MAVTVTELSAIGSNSDRSLPILNSEAIKAQQSLTIDDSASAAFSASTTLVEIDSDTACRVEFGTAPDGNGSTFFVPANFPRQFGVTPGQKVFATEA